MSYFSTSDNVKLYYETCGEGKPIVLIHGWSCSHLHFKDQIKFLSKKYKIVAIDLRGHGLSEVPPFGLTIDRFAKDIKELIDTLKLNKPSLVGWSMGTTIIFDFVRQFGCSNIDKLCLIDMTPKMITDNDWHSGLYGNFSPKDDLSLLCKMNAAWDKCSKAFVPNMFAKTGCKDKNLEKWAFGEALKNSPTVMVRMWLDMSFKDQRFILPSITAPTLITHGEESCLYLKENSEYLNKTIPNSKLVSFPHCGHALQLEDPEKFNKELSDFIG